MNKLVSSISNVNKAKKTTTTNGMKARVSTANSNLDLFFKIGGSRGTNILPDFINAYAENQEHALKIAMWSRDIREGAGERQTYLDIIKYLEAVNVSDAMVLVKKVSELGRFKDLFSIDYENIDLQNLAFEIVKNAIFNENNALAAKWTPRKGDLANKFRKYLGLTPKEYRQTLKDYSHTLEQKMSSNLWNEIEYSHVPSVAMSRNKKAFLKHDEDRFNSYKTKLQKGETKVNAGAIYPYDILKSLNVGGDKVVAQAQWEALPNFLDDKKILAMLDMSGSMMQDIGTSNITARDIASSIGIYIADKTQGAFKNITMTFSESPEFVNLKGDLLNKHKQVTKCNALNTDLEAAFGYLLEFSMLNNVPSEDMPEYLLIVSDMQFDDSSIRGKSVSALKMIESKYLKSGYKMPKIVFWNLVAHENVPSKFNKDGVALISGFSPSIMKSVLSAKDFNPLDVMLETINKERYSIER